MPKPDLSYERSHDGLVAGIDEAGRGPWAGPVVAAAVIIPNLREGKRLPKGFPKGINDSKKIPPEQREELYGLLISQCHYGVGTCSVEEIDTLNILQATLLAMARAVDALGIAPDVALVDGNRPPTLRCKVQTIVDGDALCLSIAAASIIAKVTRDRMMRRLAEECPGYGWERNAGYGTAEHQQGLATLGVTPHHRRSYAPIKLLLGQSVIKESVAEDAL